VPVNGLLGMPLGRRFGRSIGDTLGNEVRGFSLGDIERLGYGSDDGILLGDVLAEGLEGTPGRTFGISVLGMPLGRTLGRSLGDTLGNEVIGFSLGDIETLGYALGPEDGIWIVSFSPTTDSPAPGDETCSSPGNSKSEQPVSRPQSSSSSSG
jgi:hypothetical protein